MTNKYIDRFHDHLLRWFQENKRSLPWRKSPDWYKTYLSEVILQQTTIEQGLPYFEKFLKTYPSITELARADEQDILNLWAGLGYYSRARNLLKAAKIIVGEHNACFPAEYKKALKIPGVGPYSASAILSIAYKKPFPAIDGNVVRVISRIFAIKDDIRQAQTLKIIKNKAEKMLNRNHPGDYNEAVMELGAMVCTPRKPLCRECPINSFCKAFANNVISEIPYKSPAKARKKKYQIVCILKHNSKFLIGHNPDKGLLAGMWELPAIELNQKHFEKESRVILKKNNIVVKSESKLFRHIYSHIDLTFKAIIAESDQKNNYFNQYTDHRWIKLEEVETYPIHNAHKKILNWYKGEAKNQTREKGKN